MIIGAVSAFMAVILLILSVAAVCIAKGYIHIGVNGDVYIQSDAVTDSDGIGSEVEGKLNAIDSVLESFYFGDVDDESSIPVMSMPSTFTTLSPLLSPA